jgi:hypothetical protein
MIDDLQAENSNLSKKIKELERNPHPSEEAETNDNTSAPSSRADEIKRFGRLYAYTVNMFITPKECAPSKERRSYDPSLRFGTHRKEGNFRELAEQIPQELGDELANQLEFFRKNVEYLADIVEERC